jgi:hypothetical protein
MMSDHENQEPAADAGAADHQPDVLDTLSETAQRFLGDSDLDAAEGRDLPDDETGEEVPQDGDPGR